MDQMIERRTLLKTVGLAGVGSSVFGTASWVGEVKSSPLPISASSDSAFRPRVALTGGEVAWGVRLAQHLMEDAELTLLAQGSAVRPSPVPMVEVDLADQSRLSEILEGVPLVIHSAAVLETEDAAERIERRTRLTYNLLQAAVRAKVANFVYLSTLRMLESYDPSFLVDEDWQPLAYDEATGLSSYLGEFVCREFAREGLVRVITLRFGRLLEAGDKVPQELGASFVRVSDALEALRSLVRLLTGPKATSLSRWTVLHIAGACPPGRFPTARAARLLGYSPASE